MASLSCRTRWPHRPHGATLAGPTRHASSSLLSCLALLSGRSGVTLQGQEVLVQHCQVVPSLPHDAPLSILQPGPRHLPLDCGHSILTDGSLHCPRTVLLEDGPHGAAPCLNLLPVPSCPLNKGLILRPGFRDPSWCGSDLLFCRLISLPLHLPPDLSCYHSLMWPHCLSPPRLNALPLLSTQCPPQPS